MLITKWLGMTSTTFRYVMQGISSIYHNNISGRLYAGFKITAFIYFFQIYINMIYIFRPKFAQKSPKIFARLRRAKYIWRRLFPRPAVATPKNTMIYHYDRPISAISGSTLKINSKNHLIKNRESPSFVKWSRFPVFYQVVLWFYFDIS